jgi:hypothetical protein
MMPDPSIHSATEAWSESGTFGCAPLRASGSGTDTFRWSNGRKTVLAYTHTNFGGYDDTRAIVTSGEFKGMRVRYLGLATADPFHLTTDARRAARICGLGQSMSAPLFYAGLGRFTDLAGTQM